MFAIGDREWPGVSKLIEEMGELHQVLGKLMGSRGSTEHWSGDLRKMLHEELADVLASVHFVIERNNLDHSVIDPRVFEKLTKFSNWHQGDPEK